MRSKIRQRCSSALKAFTAAAALFVLHALAASPSFAVQIFIDSAFVHRRNIQCIVQITTSGTPQFRCPPYPDAICAASSNAGFCSALGVSPCCPDTCASCGPGGTSLLTTGGDPSAGISRNPLRWGNISNEPHIEFQFDSEATTCMSTVFTGLPFGVVNENICNAALFMCASVGYGNTDSGTSSTDIAIDELSFEIFKFQDGGNPNDDASTPPLRTFFIDSPGVLEGGGCTSSDPACGPLGPFCVLWDGAINIQGEFGKTNGQYGFRAKTKTNQTGASGNIQITAVRSYPSGATRDGSSLTGEIVTQKPIIVDVVDVHVMRSSPTMVGSITPVPVQPYTISYRLSKDATTTIQIEAPENGQVLRNVLPGIARVGEGSPTPSLGNADSWNGRADNGQLLPPGVYMARINAAARDQYGLDFAAPQLRQIALDPLQITDIRVQPILDSSTSLALLDYQLSEPATVYIDIYPPGTQFCRLSGFNVNDSSAG